MNALLLQRRDNCREERRLLANASEKPRAPDDAQHVVDLFGESLAR
jgi:hypothetical protein